MIERNQAFDTEILFFLLAKRHNWARQASILLTIPLMIPIFMAAIQTIAELSHRRIRRFCKQLQSFLCLGYRLASGLKIDIRMADNRLYSGPGKRCHFVFFPNHH